MLVRRLSYVDNFPVPSSQKVTAKAATKPAATRARSSGQAKTLSVERAATYNCARYAPYYNLNAFCFTYDAIGGTYWTPGYAIRTANWVGVSSSALISVCYTHSNGGDCDTSLNVSTVTGTGTHINGSGGNSV